MLISRDNKIPYLPVIVTAKAIEKCSDLSVFVNVIMINAQCANNTDQSTGGTTRISSLFLFQQKKKKNVKY